MLENILDELTLLYSKKLSFVKSKSKGLKYLRLSVIIILIIDKL